MRYYTCQEPELQLHKGGRAYFDNKPFQAFLEC
jgi:hypothetical protein